MGYEHHDRSNSTVMVVVAILALAVIGLLVVGGAGAFWLRTARMEVAARETAVAARQRDRALAAEQAAMEAAMRASSRHQTAPPNNPGTQLSLIVTVDRNGKCAVDREEIDLDELRLRLTRLKDKTRNAFHVRFETDGECPAKYIARLLDLCDAVGDVDVRVVSHPE